MVWREESGPQVGIGPPLAQDWATLGSGCYGKALSLHEVIGGQCEPSQAEP